MHGLEDARAALGRHGDRANEAHAGYLQARRLLLIGRLDEAQAILEGLDPGALPPASRAGARLVAAGIDRTRVVSGKSVSVRVDLGGRRIIKKNIHRSHQLTSLDNTQNLQSSLRSNDSSKHIYL